MTQAATPGARPASPARQRSRASPPEPLPPAAHRRSDLSLICCLVGQRGGSGGTPSLASHSDDSLGAFRSQARSLHKCARAQLTSVFHERDRGDFALAPNPRPRSLLSTRFWSLLPRSAGPRSALMGVLVVLPRRGGPAGPTLPSGHLPHPALYPGDADQNRCPRPECTISASRLNSLRAHPHLRGGSVGTPTLGTTQRPCGLTKPPAQPPAESLSSHFRAVSSFSGHFWQISAGSRKSRNL